MKRRDFLKAATGGAASLCIGAEAEARANLQPPENAVAMLYDATLCIGCKACVSKCKEVNGMPPVPHGEDDMWDAALDLSGDTLNIIKMYRDGEAHYKDKEVDGYSFIKRSCMHCVDAGCVSVCPVSAMLKDDVTGIVSHDKDRCIGCRYCVVACPYNVPRFEIDEAFGQIQKCQFCNQPGVERLDKGMLPGCVEVCPTGATLFGSRKELLQEARRRLALTPGETYSYPRDTLRAGRSHEKPAPEYQQHIFGEKEGGGTQVMHIAGVPLDKLGLPRLPERSYASVSETVQHTIYKGMAAPTVALVGLAYLVRRNTNKDDDQGEE